MGWANCGEDSRGRPIGYVHPARCDHPGCKAKIDRGLGYACGDMHGDHDGACEGYFCGDHLVHRFNPDLGEGHQYCLACAKAWDDIRESEFQEAVEAALGCDDWLECRRLLAAVLVRWDELETVPADPALLTGPGDLQRVQRHQERMRSIRACIGRTQEAEAS